jgi:hypothetical protein
MTKVELLIAPIGILITNIAFSDLQPLKAKESVGVLSSSYFSSISSSSIIDQNDRTIEKFPEKLSLKTTDDKHTKSDNKCTDFLGVKLCQFTLYGILGAAFGSVGVALSFIISKIKFK